MTTIKGQFIYHQSFIKRIILHYNRIKIFGPINYAWFFFSKINRLLFRPILNFFVYPRFNLDFCTHLISLPQTYSTITDIIKAGKPAMIGRVGGSEGQLLINHLHLTPKNLFHRYYLAITHGYCRSILNYDPYLCEQIRFLSGLFPITPKIVKRFCKLYLADMLLMDLTSFVNFPVNNSNQVQLSLFKKQLKNCLVANTLHVNPLYNIDYSWLPLLAGKKVLVVHPFEKSIISQYKNRTKIFNDLKLLPKFQLKTLQSVQSLAGNNSGFKDWFEALNYMKDKMDKIDYEIALIGCGAYGLPLAAQAKRQGKIGIHLAGSLQSLFGILGLFITNKDNFGYFSIDSRIDIHSRYWVRPRDDEKLQNYKEVEGGMYW